ncbi:MAG: hypothetical protein WCK89_02205 [bacterium]
MNGQNDDVNPEAGTCGPGCDCGASGIGKPAKWLICGVVVLAAVGVTAARISGAKESAPQAQGFAMPAVVAGAAAPAAVAVADATWGSPLKGVSELNVVATNTEAVFLVIPSDDAARTGAIQKEVAAVAATITGRGTKVGKYLLGQDAEDYKAVVQQTGAPAVLAMVKGCGMNVVSNQNVTQDALLKAFVGASRPRAGCGPSGCGPSSAGCK